MRTGGHEFGNGGARVAAGDQALADEDGIRARTGVGEQVRSAADARFGDLDDLGGQTGRCARTRRDPPRGS